MTSHDNSLSWQWNKELLTVDHHVVVLEVLPLLEPLGVLVEHHAQGLPDTHGEQLHQHADHTGSTGPLKPPQPFMDPHAGTLAVLDS